MGSINNINAPVSCTIMEDSNVECAATTNAEPHTMVECMNSENNILNNEGEEAIHVDSCPRSEDNSGPCVGMRFKNADDAYTWYKDYAKRIGFKVRIDRQERSKRDGEVISRLFVCSKKVTNREKCDSTDNKSKVEQVHVMGCKVFLMVKRRRGSAEENWEVTRFQEHHNHDLVTPSSMGLKRRISKRNMALDKPCPILEHEACPRLGMQFKTADEAYIWYNHYAKRMGFRVRIDRQERSKRDKEVISRLFVCSKKGTQRKKYNNRENRNKVEQVHTKVGCNAYLMVKRRRGTMGETWEVTRFQELHNHDSPSLTNRGLCSKNKNDKCKVAVDIEPSASSEDNSCPQLGMQFKTADDAYSWYNDYARRVGFSVRIDRQERSKRDGEVISRLFVCSKQGKCREKCTNRENTSKVEQPHTRVGCQAYLMVKRRRGPVEDNWVVTRFQDVHKHELLSPAKVSSLRSHKRIRPTTEKYAEISSAYVDENNIFSSVVEGANGIENVDFTQQNLFDHQSFERQDLIADGEAGIAPKMHETNFQCITANGYPFNEAVKGRPEKQRKGTKTCSICKGHNHNKRKCPTLKGMGTMQQPESDALLLSDSHLQIGNSNLHMGNSELHMGNSDPYMNESHPHMSDSHPQMTDSQPDMSDTHPEFCALSLWSDKHANDVMGNQAVKQLFGWVVNDDGEDYRLLH